MCGGGGGGGGGGKRGSYTVGHHGWLRGMGAELWSTT